MTDQHFWFEPVNLLSECSLNESLLWIWAARVPVFNVYREKNVFESLSEWECQRLNIPPVPKGVWRAAHHLTEERLRRRYSSLKKDSREFHVAEGLQEANAMKEWLPQLIAELEPAAAQLYLKLRRGDIKARGKLLPPGVQIIDFFEQDNPFGGRVDLTDTDIPPDIWTMMGIDWVTNSVSARGQCYCDVSMSVALLMSEFPADRVPAGKAVYVGDYLLVTESDEETAAHGPVKRTPGRPAVFSWDAFHVEVADRIRSGRIPQKKEAAIQEMLSWFESTQSGRTPSRSAVSEKLTLYYRRFMSEKT